MPKRAKMTSLHVNNGTLLFFQHGSLQKCLISSTFKVSWGEYIGQIDQPFDEERWTYSKLVLNVRCPTCFREHWWLPTEAEQYVAWCQNGRVDPHRQTGTSPDKQTVTCLDRLHHCDNNTHTVQVIKNDVMTTAYHQWHHEVVTTSYSLLYPAFVCGCPQYDDCLIYFESNNTGQIWHKPVN